MNEFIFEQTPWEAFLSPFQSGSSVPALPLLTMLEGEDDDTIEDLFLEFAERDLLLDISSLPKPGSLGQAALRLKEEESIVRNGFRFQELGENDPLRVYLEEIAAIPAFGDETLLAEEHAAGRKDNASQLTNLGLSSVIELAKEYVGYGVLLLDLIQEGSIGLWQGIQTYSTGDYAAYRDRMIRNALAKAVFLQAHSSGIAQKLRQSLQDYRSADDKLLMELGRNPSLEEIAQEIHVTMEEAETIQKMMGDALLLDQVEKAAKPQEQEATGEDNLAVEDTAYFQMRQRISELLSLLTKEDADILTLRFGLEKGLPMSAEDVAKKLGISSREVNAREAAALAKLRGNLS